MQFSLFNRRSLAIGLAIAAVPVGIGFADTVGSDANKATASVDGTHELLAGSSAGGRFVLVDTKEPSGDAGGCNANDANPVTFKISSDKPWLTVTPSEERVKGCGDTVTWANAVNVAYSVAAGAEAGSQATITAVPFGGKKDSKFTNGSFIVKVKAPTAPTKKDQTISFTAPSATYGDADIVPGATATSGLPVSYSSSTTDDCTIEDGKIRVHRAGTCTVTAAQGGNDTWNPAPSVSRTFTIARKAVTGSFTTADKVYDGNASAVANGLALAGTVDSDDVSLTGGTASFADENAGSAKTVTLSGASLSGTKAANYALASVGTQTASIIKKDVSASFTAADKVYNGQPGATVESSSLSQGDVISGDSVGLVAGSAQFADKNVGQEKAVAAATGWSLSGTDAGNYKLSVVSTTASITPKSTDGKLEIAHKVYDGSTSATITEREVSGAVAGDAVKLTGGKAEFANKNVGTGKMVNTTGPFSLSGTDAGNYELGQVTAGSANITAKEVVGSFTAADKVYDGSTVATITARSLAGTVGEDVVSLNGGTAAFNSPAVGQGKTVTGTGFGLVGADSGNYSLKSTTLTTTASIGAWEAKGFHAPIGAANSSIVAPGGTVPQATSSTAWQTAKGGSTIPLKFNAFAGQDGAERTSTSDIGSFNATKLGSCSASGVDDPVEQLASAGSSSLRYDTTERQFIQNWKTSTVSGDTCFRVALTLQDGTAIYTFVKLRK